MRLSRKFQPQSHRTASPGFTSLQFGQFFGAKASSGGGAAATSGVARSAGGVGLTEASLATAGTALPQEGQKRAPAVNFVPHWPQKLLRRASLEPSEKF